MDVHELTAGYALDALDPDERRRYEEHLASCERCRDELQGFWQVSGALGRAAGGPMPPASLRERILEQARSERPNVVPLRRRVTAPVLASAAAVAAVVAVALGVWSLGLSNDLDDANSRLEVLEDPNARMYESDGGEANLVVTPTGRAALVVRRLAPAPAGKDYEIWVFEDGVPHRAGLFERPGVAVLSRPVEPGQTVAVTLERDGGVDAPTGDPVFTASSA
jgi:anti-sigma factor RsiW